MSVRDSFKGLYRLCQCKCGTLIPCINKMGNFAKFKKGHNSNGKSQPKGKDHWCWKGGKSNRYEYIVIYKPYYKYSDKKGYVSEHRYIYYIYLSILNGKPTYLPENYDIHHINGNEKDNRISNLQLMSKSEHTIHHNIGNQYSKKDMSNRICNLCESKTSRKVLRNGKYYDLWHNDINGHICDSCYRIIAYFRKRSLNI